MQEKKEFPMISEFAEFLLFEAHVACNTITSIHPLCALESPATREQKRINESVSRTKRFVTKHQILDLCI